MSIVVKHMPAAGKAIEHLSNAIFSGRKKSERDGSVYKFLREHGLAIRVEAADGTEVPDDFAAKFAFAINPPKCEKGNSKRGRPRKPLPSAEELAEKRRLMKLRQSAAGKVAAAARWAKREAAKAALGVSENSKEIPAH